MLKSAWPSRSDRNLAIRHYYCRCSNEAFIMKITKALFLLTTISVAAMTSAPAVAQQQRPNIVIIWGDDIGQSNVSAYSRGMMGYRTPNIDRLANEGVMFTDYYAEQ